MTRKRWSPTEAAHALSISDRHLRRLVSEGVLTPDKAGGFDPIPTLQAYLRHVTKDADGKAARTALARVETIRKRLLTRRQVGEMITREELTEFATDIWVRTLGAWNAAAAHLFHALTGVVDQREQYRIASLADDAGKSEINRLRDDLEARLKGLRRDLRDDDRIERLLVELATNAEGDHDDGGDDQ
jgi:hypothetical protein